MIGLRTLLAALAASMARDEAQVARTAQALRVPAQVGTVEAAPVAPLEDPLARDLEEIA